VELDKVQQGFMPVVKGRVVEAFLAAVENPKLFGFNC
jgi:hypothetical protein